MKTLVHATRPRHWTMAALLGAALVGPANAQTPAVAPGKQRYVQGSWVNLREAAQPQARVVAQLPANTVLQQLTERDGWCAVLYAGDPRLGPTLPQPLQAHVACNLLADQPLTLAQAGKDAARAFWVAPSPNRLRAYGNALPRPAALQVNALAKTHALDTPVQYPQRPEWEAAKKLLRAGVLLRPEQEVDRDQPVNPLDDVKLATRARDNIPAVAPLAAQPVLPAIAPSYFRSHASVALLHETDADGLAAVSGARASVIPTGAPVGRFARHSGPEIEYVTGFWDVGTADLAFAPPLTIYAITHQGLVGAHTMRQRVWDIGERFYPSDLPVLDYDEAERELERRRLQAAGLARQKSSWSGVGMAGEEARVEGSAWKWRVDPAALAPRTWADAREMIGAYIEAGLSKFVVRPAIPPADGTGIEEFIAEFAREMLPLQN